MAAEPTIAVLQVTSGALQSRAACLFAAISDYWALTKPEVNFLILITAFAGFYLGSAPGTGGFRIFPIIHMLLGTLLIASGSGTLNQFLVLLCYKQSQAPSVTKRAGGELLDKMSGNLNS